MAGLSGKKLLLLGFIIVLLIVIPLTVYLVQQQQKTQVGAAPTSVLSLINPTTNTASVSTQVGQSFNLDVSLNPGSNQVSFVKLVINYDQTKLATASSGLVPNSTSFPSILQGPTYSAGAITVTLSVGSDPNKVISAATRVASISFRALTQTTGTPTQVSLVGGGQTQVLSVASSDQFNENVLASTNPANITIAPSAQAATPTPTASPSPSPSASPTPTPTASPSSGGSGTGTIITVSPTPTPIGIGSPSATATPFPTPTPITQLPSVGPADFLAKIGGAAALFTIIGVILLFAL